MFTRVTERSDGGWCFWVRPWPGRGVRGPGMLERAVVARAASCAARGHSRAYLLLALERGVLGSTLGGTARGHDQVYAPCKFTIVT